MHSSFFGGRGGGGEVGVENWTELNRRPFMEKKLSFVDEMDKHGKLHKLSDGKIHSARQCFDCLGSSRCRILSSQTLVQASDQVNKVHYCNRN